VTNGQTDGQTDGDRMTAKAAFASPAAKTSKISLLIILWLISIPKTVLIN